MADAIIVSNLKITPYTQKDGIAKIVYGDDWSITIKLPTPHVTGDKYAIGLDYENTLYPPNRPLCAGSELYVLNDDELTFTLKLATARLRDWCSKLKKPMPIAIQIVRIRDNKAETLLLDSLLALPSVFDGVVTVYEGDALDERLDEKMDNPPTEGEAGQVLGINEDGQVVWTTIEIPEQEQADWDESDSEAKSYIRNKPELATVATTGSYNDLTDKPEIPEQKQADWDESDSSDPAYIRNKPEATVVNDGKITVNQGGVKKGEFTVNQSGDTVIDLNDGAQSNWDESDSSDVSYIRNKPTLFSGDYNDLSNKPNLATVATSGSYNDLTDKPIITAPVNADWDESDSSNLSYILNKPALATVATTGSYTDLTNKPNIAPDGNDYLCFTGTVANSTVRLDKVGTDSYIPTISLEYSTDKATWTEYTWSGMTGATITLANIGDKVWLRGDNARINQGIMGYHQFVMTGGVEATGNIMSLFSKDCSKTDIVGQFTGLFRDCTALVKADVFPSRMGKITGLEMTFMGCTGLTSVELPDCTLSGNYVMTNTFNGCTNLARVKVGFHEWSSGGMNNWLGNVAVNGVFICPSDLPIARGINRIPTGWKVEFESAPQADWSASDTSNPSYILNKPDLSTKLDAPTTAGTVGQVLKKTATGTVWDNDDDEDTLDALDDTITMLTSIVGELSDKNYFHFTALEPSSVTFLGTSFSNDYEYSYDRREWFKASIPLTVSLNTGEVLWIRNGGENVNSWDFVNSSLFTGVGGVSVGGELLSLVSKSIDSTKVFSYGGRRIRQLFMNWTTLKGIEPSLNLNINGFKGDFYGTFQNTGLTDIPDNFAFPEGVTSASSLFYNCSSLTNVGAGFVIPSSVTNATFMCYGCTSLTTIGDNFTIPNSVTDANRMFDSCNNLTTIGNNVSINPGTNSEGSLNKNNITTIGTGFDYMSSYTTSSSSGQAVFPNATIGSGWKIYQYSDL